MPIPHQLPLIHCANAQDPPDLDEWLDQQDCEQLAEVDLDELLLRLTNMNYQIDSLLQHTQDLQREINLRKRSHQ